MRYPFICDDHGEFEVQAPMAEGPPPRVVCPRCNVEARRRYETSPEIWNTDGSSRDYFKENMGRGQPADKKEWLNKNWSEKTGQPPPPADSVGTYDGIPRPRQVIRKRNN